MKKTVAESITGNSRRMSVRALCEAAASRKESLGNLFFSCTRVQTLYSSNASLLSQLRHEQTAPKEDDRKS